MAVTKAEGQQKPEHSPALIEAMGRKASVGIAAHEGEFVIPRGVVAASPQLVGAIEKAFQKASEITGEPMDWLDYVVRGDGPRRVFDAGPGGEGGHGGGATGSGGSPGGGGPGGDASTGDFDALDTYGGYDFGYDGFSHGITDALGQVGGYDGPGGVATGLGEEVGYGGVTADTYGPDTPKGSTGFFDDPLGFFEEQFSTKPGGGLSTTQGQISAGARAAMAMLGGPLALSVPGVFGFMMNELGAKPGTDQDFSDMASVGVGADAGDWQSEYAGRAAPVVQAARQWSRPAYPDLGELGGLFGGMDERQIRTAIATRALHDDPRRGYYSDDPQIQGTYNTLARRALIGEGGGLNPISDTLMPIELSYLNRARGLTVPRDNTGALLGMLG